MSKKALLTEEVTRKMMKLANIGSLSDKFVNETYKMEEDEIEEGMGGSSYMEEEDEDPADDAPADLDEPMDLGPEGEEGSWHKRGGVDRLLYFHDRVHVERD